MHAYARVGQVRSCNARVRTKVTEISLKMVLIGTNVPSSQLREFVVTHSAERPIFKKKIAILFLTTLAKALI